MIQNGIISVKQKMISIMDCWNSYAKYFTYRKNLEYFHKSKVWELKKL